MKGPPTRIIFGKLRAEAVKEEARRLNAEREKEWAKARARAAEERAAAEGALRPEEPVQASVTKAEAAAVAQAALVPPAAPMPAEEPRNGRGRGRPRGRVPLQPEVEARIHRWVLERDRRFVTVLHREIERIHDAKYKNIPAPSLSNVRRHLTAKKAELKS
jgi:hypothetical protein